MPGGASATCTLHPTTMWACCAFALRKAEGSAGVPRSSNKLWLLELPPMPKTHATRKLGRGHAQASGVDEIGTPSSPPFFIQSVI